MIAFGCCISEPDAYAAYAAPGIGVAEEADSRTIVLPTAGTVTRTLNLLLEMAGELADLEALVLVHPHAQIADPQLAAKLREAFADPQVAVVGCAGAGEVSSLAWWEGSVVCGEVTHRYIEFGGGEQPAFSWVPTRPPPADVDTVDGFLMALSPWAVRELRFDELLRHAYGFDLDLCLQARAAGRKVRVADLRVIEHRPLEIIDDLELWMEVHVRLARKWQGQQMLSEPLATDARLRARRTEAEWEAARVMSYFHGLAIDAQREQLERELALTLQSPSWRLTRPLREANRWRRERKAQVP